MGTFEMDFLHGGLTERSFPLSFLKEEREGVRRRKFQESKRLVLTLRSSG
jgi:hypothetical protein